jgi:hypothetical protein
MLLPQKNMKNLLKKRLKYFQKIIIWPEKKMSCSNKNKIKLKIKYPDNFSLN